MDTNLPSIAGPGSLFLVGIVLLAAVAIAGDRRAGGKSRSVKAFGVELPIPSPSGRRGSMAIGALSIILGLVWLTVLWRLAGPSSGEAVAGADTTAAAPASTDPATPPATPPATGTARVPGQPVSSSRQTTGDLSIEVRRADGQPGPLGRDVQLVGHIRAITMPCFWGGWEVHAAHGFVAQYVKRELHPDGNGNFVETSLQMGSPGETGSVWHPFIVGATKDGCAFLRRNLAETGIGQYNGATWPPPGVKVLYTGGPVHRDE